MKPGVDPRAAFVSTISGLANHRHLYEVFRDFVIMSACSIANAVEFRQEREDTYLACAKRYDRKQLDGFAKLLALVVMGLEHQPSDFLGDVFMSLELGSDRAGQFFTPYHISKLMAGVTVGDLSVKAELNGFVTVSEPACGAGGMVIALAETMREHGLNPQQQMWVQCIDVDRVAASMCYIQLSLIHIPAQIIIGNTLSLEYREFLYTPAHILGFWSNKLARRDRPLSLEPESPVVLTEQLSLFDRCA